MRTEDEGSLTLIRGTDESCSVTGNVSRAGMNVRCEGRGEAGSEAGPRRPVIRGIAESCSVAGNLSRVGMYVGCEGRGGAGSEAGTRRLALVVGLCASPVIGAWTPGGASESPGLLPMLALPDVVGRFMPGGVAVPTSEPVPPSSSSGSIGSSRTESSSPESRMSSSSSGEGMLDGCPIESTRCSAAARSSASSGLNSVGSMRAAAPSSSSTAAMSKASTSPGSSSSELGASLGRRGAGSEDPLAGRNDGGGTVPSPSRSIPSCAISAMASTTASTSTGRAYARPEARVAPSSAARAGSPRKNTSGGGPSESSRSRSTASIAPG